MTGDAAAIEGAANAANDSASGGASAAPAGEASAGVASAAPVSGASVAATLRLLLGGRRLGCAGRPRHQRHDEDEGKGRSARPRADAAVGARRAHRRAVYGRRPDGLWSLDGEWRSRRGGAGEDGSDSGVGRPGGHRTVVEEAARLDEECRLGSVGRETRGEWQPVGDGERRERRRLDGSVGARSAGRRGSRFRKDRVEDERRRAGRAGVDRLLDGGACLRKDGGFDRIGIRVGRLAVERADGSQRRERTGRHTGGFGEDGVERGGSGPAVLRGDGRLDGGPRLREERSLGVPAGSGRGSREGAGRLHAVGASERDQGVGHEIRGEA